MTAFTYKHVRSKLKCHKIRPTLLILYGKSKSRQASKLIVIYTHNDYMRRFIGQNSPNSSRAIFGPNFRNAYHNQCVFVRDQTRIDVYVRIYSWGAERKQHLGKPGRVK